ncbi:MAG TPA: DNA-directed RNA polymerase subunit omega [Candidatus Atribacteria bacterium]|nr:DNA-directed RNA polymerase subunit omega [Candidatus Atribacteria bacterium]HPU08632.1 DNA-directed RNA polymerase subunit omega [Candidatus Atribacteria bacterium]HPZ81659.1 DNA-directed RNA polymerase subunit omega [Candidatus Atribacteria bacterium]
MLSIDELVEMVGNVYILANVVAKRIRQLNDGAVPLVELKEAHSPLFVALEELSAGKISFEFVEE